MTRLRRTLPWILAATSSLVQGLGAMTAGHFMWLAAVVWGLTLMLCSPEGAPLKQAVKRATLVSGFAGVVAGVQQWGVAYYAPSVFYVVIGYHTLVWAAFGALAMLILLRGGVLATLSVGALWALIENLRSFGSFAYPFFFGGMLADELPVAQIASVVGSTGLSGLVFWVGFSLSGVLATLWGERRWARPVHWVPALSVCALSIAGGWLRLRSTAPVEQVVRVSTLQGSIPPWMYTLASGPGPFKRLIEEHYGFLYREALNQEPPPQIVLFPETTFNWHVEPTTAGVRRITTLGATKIPKDTSLLVGASFSDKAGLGSRNGVGIVTADYLGRPDLRGLIVKRQLVPFIEVGHEAAQRWALAEVGGIRLGVMVCYESMHPQAGLFAANNEAKLLTIVSDDGGMRWAPIAWTHSQQGRMRAIEVGLPLVRAGQVGLSYATDAYGRQLGELEWWAVGQLTSDVPLQSVPTIYRRVGLWWTWVWVALAFGPIAFLHRRTFSRSSRQ